MFVKKYLEKGGLPWGIKKMVYTNMWLSYLSGGKINPLGTIIQSFRDIKQSKRNQ